VKPCGLSATKYLKPGVSSKAVESCWDNMRRTSRWSLTLSELNYVVSTDIPREFTIAPSQADLPQSRIRPDSASDTAIYTPSSKYTAGASRSLLADAVQGCGRMVLSTQEKVSLVVARKSRASTVASCNNG